MPSHPEHPSARLLTLLSLLANGRPYSGGELTTRLATSARTLRRDMDRLRELGYRVESTRGTGGGYRLVDSAGMPPLPLARDEAVALAIGLRHAMAYEGAAADPTRSVLNRVEQLLPARARQRFAAVLAETETAPGGDGPADPAVLGQLATAARLRSLVRFRYTTRDGRESERRVEPYRQVWFAGYWYLRAWDLDRADWRGFRLDRIHRLQVPGATFTPRTPPGASEVFPPCAASTPPGANPEGARAGSVLFLAAREVVAPRLAARAGVLETVSTDRCRYGTAPDDWDWLSGVLATVDVPYVIERPPELLRATRRLVERAGNAAKAAATTRPPAAYGAIPDNQE